MKWAHHMIGSHRVNSPPIDLRFLLLETRCPCVISFRTAYSFVGDLEGIVAKRRDGAYGEDWFKIRNPRYSQYEGRRELLERTR